MNFLIDTNILSELAKPRPNPGVLLWADGQTVLGVSAVTIDEIVFGLSWKPKPAFRAHLENYLAEHCDIFPVTEVIARRSGELRGNFCARGIVREQSDMLIAATAQIHALTLVTRNTADFAGCGIPVLNPFSV